MGSAWAVEPLNMEGFDEVKTWFDDAAIVLTMENPQGEMLIRSARHGFHMMFYRVDTFAELGLEIPRLGKIFIL